MLMKNLLKRAESPGISNIISKNFSTAKEASAGAALSTRFHEVYLNELQRIQKNTYLYFELLIF